MNTKTFAQLARTNLMKGVENKLNYWGFDKKGNITESPEKIEGGYLFRGEVYDDANALKLWNSLKSAIGKKGIDVVKEEAAYTWFNRMMAIYILAKNNYEQPQLEYAGGMMLTPIMLQRARQGYYDFLSADEQRRLKKILPDYSQDQASFALLLIGYCHSHTLLKNIFGGIDDYTELLLPDNMLSDNGFLHLLNTTDAISDEQYREVELIGWLYQFYISDRKDEVFASFKKNKKAEAKDIPAATQIFTPNWIVKYMVQNTVGKLWLDLHPDSPIKKEMKYLVEGENPEYGNPIIKEAVNIKLLDPACGSGHILVEGFDLLYQMYIAEYYTSEEAVESIFKNNLFGLDIDKRAAQLARFAVYLKAAKQYPGVLKKGWMPHIYAMPEPLDFNQQEVFDFLGSEGIEYEEALSKALLLMKEAQNLGSIMQLDLTDKAVYFFGKRLSELQQKTYKTLNDELAFVKLSAYIEVILVLGQLYEAVVANPPYMGQKSMNDELKNYLNTHYPKTKSDLMTVFMEVIPNLSMNQSRFALINLPSWLFLSSFEEIREDYIKKYQFDSLLHMGRGIFGIDFGSVAFTIKKVEINIAIGSYFRLHERNFQHIYYKDIEKLFLYSNGNKEYKYDFSQYRGEEGITEIPYEGTEKGLQLFYPDFSQSNFSKIPGSPIAYWASEKVVDLFENEQSLKNYIQIGSQNKTADNIIFVKYIWELSSFDLNSKKWVFYSKGGSFRKWYGNIDCAVLWTKDARDYYKNNNTSNLMTEFFWFKRGISWSDVTSTGLGMRLNENHISDMAGPTFIVSDEILFYSLAYCNSKFVSNLSKILNPTLHFQIGNLKSLPFILKNIELPSKLGNNCVNISKMDWDSSETSWDFIKSPLLNDSTSLKEAYQKWKDAKNHDFFQLHYNEEELNRLFIEIYGLKNEITPDVELKDITILQDELDSKALEQLESSFRNGEKIELPIKKAVVMQQLISYAMGVFMGRYRIDKSGLHIAYPNPSKEEIASYEYNGHTVEIDEDAIIPLMGSACDFADDAVTRFKGFLDVVWGEETHIKNINFLQECLNQDLEKFIINGFWKTHCSMYKKKPIYWLFASPNGAFQVLVYMHRMNAFTVEMIRSNYLINHLKTLRSKIAIFEKSESSLSAQDSKMLDELRKDMLECEQYDLVLKTVADKQISFDLDDGVTANYKLFEGVVAEIK